MDSTKSHIVREGGREREREPSEIALTECLHMIKYCTFRKMVALENVLACPVWEHNDPLSNQGCTFHNSDISKCILSTPQTYLKVLR